MATGTNKTQAALETQANVINDEASTGANTAARVGQMYLDMIVSFFTQFCGISTYDPTAVGGDAFDMDNMVEGTTTKIFTSSERSKLQNVKVDGGTTAQRLVIAAASSYVDDSRLLYIVSSNSFQACVDPGSLEDDTAYFGKLRIGVDGIALPTSGGTTILKYNSSTGEVSSESISLADISDITGTPDGSKFLRDDGVWTAIGGGGDLLAANNLSDLASASTARTN